MRNVVNSLIFVLCVFFTAHLVFAESYRRIDHVEGQASQENYIKNSGAENGFFGWAKFNDGSVAIPVDGTGGSSILTLERAVGTSLRGNAFFACGIPSNIDSQGEGCSYDYKISLAEANNGKAQKIIFQYTSGAPWTAGDLAIWVYNKDSSTLSGKIGDIAPCPTSTTCAPFEGLWYPDYGDDDYRLIIMNTVATASAWRLDFDDVKVAELTNSVGSVTTGWEDVSSLVTADCSTNNTQTAFRRRVGENTEYSVRWEFSGATNASTCGFNFPEAIDVNGPQIDGDVNQIMGWGISDDNGGSKYAVTVRTDSGDTSRVLLRDYSTSGSDLIEGSSVSNTSPHTVGSGDSVRFNFKFKTVGFQPQTVMSDAASTQDVSEIMSLNAGSHTSSGSFQDVPLNTIINSSHGGADTVGNEVDILIAGLYTIIGNIGWPVNNTGNRGCQIRIDHSAGGSTDIVSNIHSTVSTNGPKSPCSITGYPLEVGDMVTLEGFQTSGGNLTYDTQDKATFLSVSSFKGGQTIALSESASYGPTGSRPRALWARIDADATTPAIFENPGAWISNLSRTAAGDYTLTVADGICSQPISCGGAAIATTVPIVLWQRSASSNTSIRLRTTRTDTDADIDADFNITCNCSR